MASFWQTLFHHEAASAPADQPAVTPTVPAEPAETWVTVPKYLEVDPHDHLIPSLIAASVTATAVPDSQLVLKKLYVQNPEAQLVSVIASSCALATGDGQFVVKSIRKRVDQH